MTRKILFDAPDISYHNGNVNMKSVRDNGYKQVYIRAGYGRNNIDQMFQRNAQACVNLGIPVMLYWFSYALSAEMAGQEAVYAIEQAKKYWKSCPIAFDLEYDSIRYAATKGVHIDRELATDMAIAFLKKVKEEGFIPVLYFNRDYKNNYFNMLRIKTEVTGVRTWYARYSDTITDEELLTTDIWQYTSKGRIEGISGNVDINRVYSNIFAINASEAVPQDPTANLYILGFQAAANADGYKDDSGRMLKEDGIDGKRTQEVRRKVNLKARAVLFVGSTGYLVKWWQQRLNEILGTDLKVDGKFGSSTRSATVQFQRKYGLNMDGVAGYNTIQTAFYN